MPELVEANEIQEDSQRGRYLTFKLSNDMYGIEIRYVTEIVGIQKINVMPETPSYVKGIINLRGKIIPVIDMRLRLRQPPMEYNDRTCIIVVDINNQSIGLIVDAVDEVVELTDDAIAPPPELAVNSRRYLKGIGKFGDSTKLLLDCNRLFNDNEIDMFGEIQ